MRVAFLSSSHRLVEFGGLDARLHYVVLEMDLATNDRSVRIFDPERPETPPIVPLDELRITDRLVPPNWIVDRVRVDRIVLRPASWATAGYWERYFEGERTGLLTAEGLLAVHLSDSDRPFSYRNRTEAPRLYVKELAVILHQAGFTLEQAFSGSVTPFIDNPAGEPS